MVLSIIVYTSLFCVMLFFAIITSKVGLNYIADNGRIRERSFWSYHIIIPLLLFAIIFGLRYDVGVDYLSYLQSYFDYYKTDRFEFVFGPITKVLSQNGIHFSIYFGLLAFIQICFFFLAFNKERYLFPYLLFFLVTTEEWLDWMNIIRQGVAICIWLYSIKYIEEKKFWKYLLWVIIAFGFHRSVIILLAFYPILKNGKDYFKNIKVQIILFFTAFILRYFFEPIVANFDGAIGYYATAIGKESLQNSYSVDRLVEGVSQNQGSGLASKFRIILNFIIILYSTKLKTFYKSSKFNILYFFFFSGLIIYYFLPVGAIEISRPFKYLYIFKLIMYAYFCYFLYKTKTPRIRLVLYSGILIAFVCIFYLSILTSNHDAKLWYQFFFNQ